MNIGNLLSRYYFERANTSIFTQGGSVVYIKTIYEIKWFPAMNNIHNIQSKKAKHEESVQYCTQERTQGGGAYRPCAPPPCYFWEAANPPPPTMTQALHPCLHAYSRHYIQSLMAYT